MIHRKCQVLFSQNNNKKIIMSSGGILHSTSTVLFYLFIYFFYMNIHQVYMDRNHFSNLPFLLAQGLWRRFFLLHWGLTTRQPLWVILCCLPEKGKKQIVDEMKEGQGRKRNKNEGKKTEEITRGP